MRSKALYFLLLLASFSYGQTCSSISTPVDGDIDVPVDSPIRWTAIPDIIGYVVSLGTTPGGIDIINRRSSGLNNFYVPEVGLPSDTQIYVTISYYKAGQPFTTCEVETFRTVKVTEPPNCTSLERPLANTSNIEAETDLRWAYAATANGYLLSIGTTPDGTEVVDNLDVGNVLRYDPPNGLPADREVFVSITPYNDIGAATHCSSEGFITTSAVVDCGPFFDYVLGRTVFLGPEIDFPERIGICKSELTKIITSTDSADGFRWYAINLDGSETLLSSTNTVEINVAGSYRYEAYNLIEQSGTAVECSDSRIFSVISSESAVIGSIKDEKKMDGRTITVNVEGTGNYEFAIDNRNGPYQGSPVFTNVSQEYHAIFVRDKNGCGIIESSIERNLSLDDFPKFFTPNGDNINDYWQFITPERENEIVLTAIHIFNKYGHLLAIIDPKSRGWDGNYQGLPLPSSDYWFKAISLNNQEIRGHFSLKR